MDNSEASSDPRVFYRLLMTADIVRSFVSHNKMSPAELPELIRTVHQSLTSLGAASGQQPTIERPKPAVPIAKSIHNEFIVCLEDGKKLKMLKRHLRSTYGMTPDEYRRRWGLPPDYPMVAPAYATRRSEFAKKIGLGRGLGARRQENRD